MPTTDTPTIDRDELKAKLDAGDDFRLVMTMGDWAFDACRIPGSINIAGAAEAEIVLAPGDEIVVYCSDARCRAGRWAAQQLRRRGYQHVRLYAGGLADWEAAGYPLEGSSVEPDPSGRRAEVGR
jgi:rhodanese-related sulfurtransferase